MKPYSKPYSITCPYCGRTHEMVTKISGPNEAPTPGRTILVCISCENPIWVSEAGAPEKMSPEILEALRLKNPATHYEVIRTIMALKEIKSKKN